MSVSSFLDLRQAHALAAVSWRELRWVLPATTQESAIWLRRAERIPSPALRRDAVESLVNDRFNVNGAAVFASIPRTRNESLLRLLVRYQIMFDYLDTISERPCADVVRNGTQLHRAAVEALDPGRPPSNYYRHHPGRDDGGYLRALVAACQAECSALPSFAVVRPYLLEEADRLEVCALNHALDSTARDRDLEAWARTRFPSASEHTWFELTAASTSSVTIFALLALAAEPGRTDADAAATRSAYFPWISLASTMFDSYTDIRKDRASGAHSYVGHYGSLAYAVERLGEIGARSIALARSLPRGRRHALVPAGMLAMYLSDPETRTRRLREASERILSRGGWLPQTQLLILRAWRRLQRRPTS